MGPSTTYLEHFAERLTFVFGLTRTEEATHNIIGALGDDDEVARSSVSSLPARSHRRCTIASAVSLAKAHIKLRPHIVKEHFRDGISESRYMNTIFYWT
jgi:hypothetical protein